MIIKAACIFMVFIGALFLALALPRARRIRANLRHPDRLHGKWCVLFNLMVFFLISYIFFELVLILNLEFLVEIVIGGVFLGAALFVFLIIHISQRSLAAKQEAEDTLRESEARFHEIFDSVNEGIIIMDPADGAILEVNATMCRMFGLHRDELRWIDLEELRVGAGAHPAGEWRKRSFNAEPWIFEWLVKGKEGVPFWVEGQAHIAHINGAARLLVSMRDINQRKRLEKRISRLNECFLGFSARHAENIGRLTNLCGELMEGVCAMYNRIEGEMRHTHAAWNAPPDFELSDTAAGQLCRDVVAHAGDNLFCVRNLGQTPYAESDPSVRRYNLHTYVGIPVKCSHAIVGSLSVVFQKDFSPDEEDGKFLGILASAIGVEEERRTAAEALQKARSELESRVLERTAELANANERLRIDIAERKKAEEALWKSESILRKVFEVIPDSLAVIDRDLRIIQSNWKGGYGYIADALRSASPHCYDAYYPEQGKPCDDCHVLKVFETRRTVSAEKYNSRFGLMEVYAFPILDDSGEVVMVAEHVRNITERRKLEEELRKAHKLESLGVLAGGIAHDFNNLLTAILGNISLAKLTTESSDSVTTLGQAEKAVCRARDLTQQLMTFSKGGAPVKKTVSIEQIVKDSASFVLRGSNVKCEYTIPDSLWPVEVDEGQISQVINNLIINADQSMEDGGIVEVGIENAAVPAVNEMALKEGRYVKISIRDGGAGIPREFIHKIFDPYFTTKQKGTGLGLATVYSIIKNHGGYIGVNSEVGVGTTFQAYLPASKNGVQKTTPVQESCPPGSGRILVMDDEELIREVAAKILKHLGYRAVVCCDGREATELYQRAMAAGEPFAAVIMDLTIPGGMGGKETMQHLLALDRGVIGIVSSGYCNDPILSRYRDYGFSGIMGKPYSPAELGKVLHDLLSPHRGLPN